MPRSEPQVFSPASRQATFPGTWRYGTADINSGPITVRIPSCTGQILMSLNTYSGTFMPGMRRPQPVSKDEADVIPHPRPESEPPPALVSLCSRSGTSTCCTHPVRSRRPDPPAALPCFSVRQSDAVGPPHAGAHRMSWRCRSRLSHYLRMLPLHRFSSAVYSMAFQAPSRSKSSSPMEKLQARSYCCYPIGVSRFFPRTAFPEELPPSVVSSLAYLKVQAHAEDCLGLNAQHLSVVELAYSLLGYGADPVCVLVSS